MLTESTNLKSVEIVTTELGKAVNVLWVTTILRDGVMVSEAFHRCAYCKSDKESFLSTVEGAIDYLPILGWE